ncbi:flagellar export chaperone FlgN [Planctellipticum variicoloris]|uniref:flagellar export chaperone FlgN n=1 Tax=Planctellipticum variicoloris TaxID=3064265 RepID=UPI002CA8F9D9|nr:flagellar protein FlgN [Planctomycetaceae bacterium SH412]HTN02330.1 flagellar export chaperone FlgN [Planctomycetaceae bacterium]
MSSGTDLPDYLAAFRERRALCAALLELSLAQSDCIRRDDYTELLALLHQKQTLLDDVARAAREQELAWSSWSDRRDRLRAAERTECEQQLAQIEDLLARLLREEQAGTHLLNQRHDATQRELASVNRGMRVREAYEGSPLNGGTRHFSIDT